MKPNAINPMTKYKIISNANPTVFESIASSIKDIISP
jgi:hypothetical protein